MTGTLRKSGLGFMQEPRRLNVAITRAINAMFVIVDVDAATSEISLNATLESKDENPDTQNTDIGRLNQAQKYLKKIIEYYIGEGCVKSVGIKQLSSKYLSFDQSNEFAVEQLKVKCLRCQETGHTKWAVPKRRSTAASEATRMQSVQQRGPHGKRIRKTDVPQL